MRNGCCQRRLYPRAGRARLSPLRIYGWLHCCCPKMTPMPIFPSFVSDNRSSYNALMLHLQGNVSRRFNLIANYTLSNANTWGCVLGELFDYVNGVCDPNDPSGRGDYGPSGEDVTSRFTLAGIVFVPGGFQVTTLIQAESARPITLTTPVDVNGLGDPTTIGAVINGVQTTMDQFRGTPYVQVDLRVTRPFPLEERWRICPLSNFSICSIAIILAPTCHRHFRPCHACHNLFNATHLCPTPACTYRSPTRTSCGARRGPRRFSLAREPRLAFHSPPSWE